MDRIEQLQNEIALLEAKNKAIETRVENEIQKGKDERFYNQEMIHVKREALTRAKPGQPAVSY